MAPEMEETRGVIENVKKIKLEIKSGDLSFYGPKEELVWRIPRAYELGLKVFSFIDGKSKARLVSLEEREVEMEAEFPEPVKCEIYDEEVVCSKY
jgi:hypothetical protein